MGWKLALAEYVDVHCSRFTLAADISLKGIYKLLAPFLPGYIRKQMTDLVLDPIRKVAESR